MKTFYSAFILLVATAIVYAQTYPGPPSQALTGSQTGGLTVPSANNITGPNQFLITSDNVARPSVGSNKLGNVVVQHSYGGAAMIGGRNSLDVESYMTAISSASNNDHNYQAANFEWSSSVNDGGTNTGGGAQGAGFAVGGAAILTSGATNWLNLTFLEANIAAATGSSVGYKSMLQLASLPQDAVQGAVTDCMICYSSLTGAVGWKNAMLLTAANGQQPLASSGCIICTTGASTITTGIDFSSYTMTGNFLNSTGFSVSGTGATVAKNVLLTPVTISALPTCNAGAKGTLAFVSDTVANAAASYHGTVAGGGANTVNSPVSCNGANWQYD